MPPMMRLDLDGVAQGSNSHWGTLISSGQVTGREGTVLLVGRD